MEEILSFVEREGLLDVEKSSAVYYKKVLSKCLAADANREILIIADRGYPFYRTSAVSGAGYLLAAKELGLDAGVVIQSPRIRGDDAEEQVVTQLEKFESSGILVLCASGKLGKLGKLGKVKIYLL